MASQVSPGIVLKERDLSSVVITGVQSITGAGATSFVKGPVGRVVNINSQRELIDTFGTPTSDMDRIADWHVFNEFLGYGGRLALVRVESSGLLNAATDSAVLLRSEEDWEAGTGNANKFIARSAGTWANRYAIAVVDRGADQYVTFASALNPLPSVGDPITVGGKTGKVLSLDTGNTRAAIVLDDPSTLITTSDTFDSTDVGAVSTYTVGAITGTSTLGDGTYTVSVNGGGAGVGASLQFSVSGGTVTVAATGALTGGTDFVATETITVNDTVLGGSGSVAFTITVDSIVDDVIAVTAVSNWYLNTSIPTTLGTLTLGAIGPRPGTSEYAAARGLKYDEVHVAVIDTTTDDIVERFQYLSKLEDGLGGEGGSAFYKTVVNEESDFIFTGTTLTGIVDNGTVWAQASTALTSGDKFDVAGAIYEALDQAGADAYAYSAADVTAAYDLFADPEGTEVDFVLMGGSLANETDTKTKAAKVISVADGRKDCIGFVSPHVGNQIGASGQLSEADQLQNTLDYFSTLASSSYAVFDSGIKYIYDRFTDQYRWIPCNGDVAGICVRTSATNDDWISPAGVARGGLTNAIKLAYNPNQAGRDALYQDRINPIVSKRGAGILLFGDKTALASPSAFSRINVRRLFLNLEKRAKGLGEAVLFEQNDVITRGSFSNAMSSYLSEVQARRGVTDFLVVADESNNTPDVIDRLEFVAEIYVKPSRAINFVTITFTATRTGVSFSEVVGR